MDLAFGDHGEIILSEAEPFKLIAATTTDLYCSGGVDNITLMGGDDIGFGGGNKDYLYGNDGQDTLVGDFGKLDFRTEIRPNRYLASMIAFPDYQGDDELFGGNDDDILIGCEGDDVIWGEGRLLIKLIENALSFICPLFCSHHLQSCNQVDRMILLETTIPSLAMLEMTYYMAERMMM